MKKTLLPFLVAAAILASSVHAAGTGPPPDLKVKVGALLERFPAESPSDKDALAAELLGLGPKAVLEVSARVLPPGAGDDAKARFALNALAVHVIRPGAEGERRQFVGALLEALRIAPEPEVKAFLISQVQIAGKEEAVRPLARYLRDGRLAEPAVQALLAIRGHAAARALLKALAPAPASIRPTLIKALGELRSLEAVKKLLPYAESQDANTRMTALFALADMGDPLAGPVLERSRVAASPFERSQAPFLYLRFARRLAESGRESQALAMARSVLAHYTAPEESHVAAQSLSLLVDVLGERALTDLLAVMDSGEPKLRGAALEIAAPLGGREATASWIEKARSSAGEVRAGIIAMLGRRGDRDALPYIRESLTGPDPAVRTAAIPAAARLGGEAVLPDLFARLGSEDETELDVLRDTLLGFSGPVIVPEAVRRLEATAGPGKSVLIDLIGEKGAREETVRIFGLAGDPDPAVRSAAVRALAKLAGEEDLPRLVKMLASASDADDVLRLQDAAASAAGRNPDPEGRAVPLLALMDKAPPEEKVAILRVLPALGGTKALQAVIEETRNPDARVRSVAVLALARWPDLRASAELLRIVKETTSPRDQLLAMEGYVQMVGRSPLPNRRKLELLRTALEEARDDTAARPVLAGLAEVREPESFRLLADHLGRPALAGAAAAGLVHMASSQAGAERWLAGHEAISILRRVEAAEEDPAERERIARVIADRLRQGGFTPLFNGRDLDGWKGLVADPPKRAGMTPEELRAAQAEADERMRAHWSVSGGVLVFDGKGENLCTLRDFGDFELLVDWKIGKGGDSGLYLRGSPQVQIWDAEANPAGSGGLYNNQNGPSAPREKADRPVGEWNTFRIIMIGERVTVYLNDRMVVDNTVLENYWERDRPIYPSGPVELQAHGNPLWFRNIFIREIPRDGGVPQVTPAEAAEGFVPLFNGRDLEGWTGDTHGYVVENGKLAVHPERKGGNLYTEKEYADFVLRFDFKLTPAANNGLGVRAPLEGDAAYAGMEIQILEDGSPLYWNLRPTQYHGSIYGVVPARRGVLRPVGEWNSEEVTVRGRRVTVVVNGTTVVDADLDAASAAGTMDGRDHPGLARDRGHIGFLGHGSLVEFRNIRLRELK
jgi:HEAT repeat protein